MMEDDQIDAEAMASMMGFSSFGDQDRPNKKRRFNPGADAAVDTPVGAVTKVPEASTGSNAAPLGERKAAQSTNNANEIDLEDDDEDNPQQATGDTLTMAGPSANLPQRPAVAMPGPSSGYPHARGGAQLHRWYEGYYDDLSNSNPWVSLEKGLGLQPRGKWMPKPERSTMKADCA